MDYTYKTWKKDDYYNFDVEFNRIEYYNEYCKRWLSYFGINVTFESKLDWAKTDIIDLKDYNRVKTNINKIMTALGAYSLDLFPISTQVNQNFTVENANKIEEALKLNLAYIGKKQSEKVTGLAETGLNKPNIITVVG